MTGAAGTKYTKTHLNKLGSFDSERAERVALCVRDGRKKSNENILIQLAHSELIQFNQRFDTINVFCHRRFYAAYRFLQTKTQTSKSKILYLFNNNNRSTVPM